MAGIAPTDSTITVAGHAVSRRLAIFLGLLLGYVLVTLSIVLHTPMLTLDHWLKAHHTWLQHKFPGQYHRVEIYEWLGQRAPTTAVLLPWTLWKSWRARTIRPFVLALTALAVLNLTVGVVKVSIGRWGPLATKDVHDLFAGGDIYPSGHVSNTVVVYSLFVLLATNHRRLAIAIGTFVSVSVGLLTIYVNTHWFSDVLGGWLAGGLVVVALPWVTRYVFRFSDGIERRVVRAWQRRSGGGPGDGPGDRPGSGPRDGFARPVAEPSRVGEPSDTASDRPAGVPAGFGSRLALRRSVPAVVVTDAVRPSAGPPVISRTSRP